MTPSELLAIVYRFYPRGLLPRTVEYDNTEERHRQREVARRAVAEYPTWDAMIRRVKASYPVLNRSEHIRLMGTLYLDGYFDAAYWGEVTLPGPAQPAARPPAMRPEAHQYLMDTMEGYPGLERPTLGFHVSLLGPYYGIARTGIPGEEPAALCLAQEIETSFPGYEQIPPEIGLEVVPDVRILILHTTTIYDCLLSDNWEGAGKPAEPDLPPLDPNDPQLEGMEQVLESVTQIVRT